MLYFAYGSNMDWVQMKERCPSARFVCIATLPDHRLAFTRRSKNRGCGVADAVLERGKRVWGVVYEIEDVDVGRLDTSEGYQPGRAVNSYRREERHVFIDGDERRPLVIFSYFANRQKKPPPPNSQYKQLILTGALHWHLPDDYVEELRAMEISR